MSQERLGALIGRTKSTVSRIEDGRVQIDLHMAKSIATALGVSLADVLEIEGATGFSEDAAPYVPEARDPFSRLIHGIENQALYVVKTDVLTEVGIAAGDVVVVDLSAAAVENVKPLAPVIAQLYGEGMAEATTIVRQYVPPNLLITNSRTANLPVVNMASEDAHIKGVIISWHRRLSQGS